MSDKKSAVNRILVTGATGYIGGRLVPELLNRGYHVRAFTRSKKKLENRPWSNHPNAEIFSGDVFDQEILKKACEGCSAAYYLVHSMLPGQKDFKEADREAALNMKKAAEESFLERIIYLGGLGEDSADLSKHLKSRAEVSRILSSGKVPVTTLRAAMIIGSGSASFEILRYLVDRLPVMITPKWLETPSQPIAIRNVIEYLVEALAHEETLDKSFDIGGSEVLTYRRLMQIYAEEAKLPKRLVIPVPVLTPRLSSYWIHLVTPVPASIARPLAEGLKNPVVCQNNEIQKKIPQKVLSPRESIAHALKRLGSAHIISHWTDAGKMPPVESVYAGDPKWAGGTILKDQQEALTDQKIESLWMVISAIGGLNGWYYANLLWVIRGFLDKVFGGVGLRRGRRDPQDLSSGDALDFWRVLSVKRESHLVLLAEMKLPGIATLEFKLTPKDGKTLVTQTALFKPRGLLGILYWYLLLPFHFFIFTGLLNQILKRARLLDGAEK